MTYGARLGGEVQALRTVPFEMARGEFVSTVGPSGCGKSTLLNMIGGLREPTAGTITYQGLEPAIGRRLAFWSETENSAGI